MKADKLSYWRYTFRPGFTLIVLITFVYAAFVALLFYLIEYKLPAIVTMIVWLQFVACCMVGHYFKYKTVADQSIQCSDGNAHYMLIRDGNKKIMYKNGHRVASHSIQTALRNICSDPECSPVGCGNLVCRKGGKSHESH